MEVVQKDKITIYQVEKGEGPELDLIDSFKAKAGFPSPAMDYVKDKISLDKLLVDHPNSTFLAEVEGSSMLGAFIPEKALLLLDKAIQVRNGDIVLAVVNDEFTVKFYERKGDAIRLLPANPSYQPINVVDGMEFRVWAVVHRIIINPREINNVKNVRTRRLQ